MLPPGTHIVDGDTCLPTHCSYNISKGGLPCMDISPGSHGLAGSQEGPRITGSHLWVTWLRTAVTWSPQPEACVCWGPRPLLANKLDAGYQSLRKAKQIPLRHQLALWWGIASASFHGGVSVSHNTAPHSSHKTRLRKEKVSRFGRKIPNFPLGNFLYFPSWET